MSEDELLTPSSLINTLNVKPNFHCSTLEYINDKTLFITYCFIVRGFEALGASAYSTASYVFVVNTFPQHIGSVLVSYQEYVKACTQEDTFQGILETFVGLGMSTGPALGGLLYSV